MHANEQATERRYERGQPVVVTWIDIPFSFWIDIAFKVTLAFFIAALVIGIPIGIVTALILSAM